MLRMTDKQRAKLEVYKKHMRSVGDRLLIVPIGDEQGEETVTAGGIIKPATARLSNDNREGVVISAGPHCREVRAGDYVTWPTRCGDFADGLQGYELMSVRERDIIMASDGPSRKP